MLSWTRMRRAIGSMGVLALLVGLTATLPTPAGAVSRPGAALLAWRVRPTPDQTVPNGALLADSCADARACVAVGYHAGSGGPFVALAETWNGTGWRVESIPTPAGASHAQLSGVSCSAVTACTAVGSYTNGSGRDLPLAERWNGTRWKIQAAPSPAGATLAHLVGVSCAAASACTAVGRYQLNSPRDIPLAERWNGVRWKIQPVPSPPGASSSDLTGVSCRPASACTAVGAYTNRSFTLLTLAERWNGARWRIQVTPNLAGAASSGLSGVSCSSSRACTAAGSSSTRGVDRALAEAWNGARWRIQVTPDPAGASGALSAVSCSSPGACTAVGAGFAERWNGTRWRLQGTPIADAILGGVACPARNACTAAGFRRVGTSLLTVAEAWNGRIWRAQATPTPGGTFGSQLNGVSCTSASACTAVGFYNRGPFGPQAPLAEAWNGSRWGIQAAPSPPGALASDLSAVSCASASACTAVGSYNESRSTTLAFADRWDGKSWTVQATPSPNPGTIFAALSGVSCTSASACTAVGAYENSAGTTLAFADRWDGTSWTVQATPSPAGATYTFLRSVSCASALACTAVGDQGASTASNLTLAERWDGTSWSIQTTPSPAVNPTGQLFGVSCSSPDACTAIGYQRDNDGIAVPLAEAWNGMSWSIQATPNPSGTHGMFLNGVSCISANACTAVGSTGDERLPIVAEQWDGTRWGVQTMAIPVGGTSADARAVSCVLANACTSVGEFRRISGTPLTLAETTF